ncbi:MAG: hypothetical protein GF346_05280, partial [Candidatus Eisenbacteria bacterium]|nr:hypothetical protein [Candidatus Latescibacterota bacterium]MBD3301839.1 hypothetical protein [Candidatus Eisenbacteria bacterium]
MTQRPPDGPLDPRREKLIGLLYGELSEAEEKEIRREIAGDATLRRDFEELVATRQLLGEWKIEEESPRYQFLDREPTARRSDPDGPLARLRRKIGSWTALPWAVATAALVLS